MLMNEVQALGSKIYGLDITPYKGHYSSNTLVLGFDTEYTSDKRELLSIQLADNNLSVFYEVDKDFKLNSEGKITVEVFRQLLRNFYKRDYPKPIKMTGNKIILYCYWSLAELQHIVIGENTIINENPFTYSLTIHDDKNRGKIEIVDLFVWYQTGLKSFAKDILGHTKDEYDTTTVTKESLLNPLFIKYAKLDAELCYQIATTLRKRFWDLFEVDIVLTQTAARTAASAFKKQYVKEPIVQDNCDVRRQALLSNWGGSSLAFNRGIYKDTFHYYDGVSMFPSCAIELKILPQGKDWFEVTNPKEYKKINGVCKVNYQFPFKENYPNLLTVPEHPFRRQIFPLNGNSHTSGKEVKLALEKNADIELLFGYGYETGLDYFSKFEEDMKEKKQIAKKSNNPVDTFIYKLMANSIIGKTKQTIMKDDINDLIKWGKRLKTNNISITKEKKLSTGGLFMPEWNTLIIGFARSIGIKAFEKVKAYVGTVDSAITNIDNGDSFIIDGILYKKDFIGYELGILRAKSYYLLNIEPDKSHIAHHGYAGKPLDFVELVKTSIDNPFIKYKKYRPTKLRTALRRDMQFGKFEPTTLIYDTGYDNSRFLNEDNTTRPFKNVKEYIQVEGRSRKTLNKQKKVFHDDKQSILFRDYTIREVKK